MPEDYGNNNLKSNQWMVGMFLKAKKLEFDSLMGMVWVC